MIPEPTGWREAAACRGMDPDLFFPAGDSHLWAGEIAVAQEVCDTCPVRTECLETALADPSTEGIWGGTTFRERERIRRRRRRMT